MNSKETLKLLKNMWCSIDDLKNLSQLGIDRVYKLKKQIQSDLEKQGYILPKGLLPMAEVVKYLKIDIEYLENIDKK